ncbi:UDP-glycosyltransferase UGT5-like [Helicoverpa zea]|uniref:UDP-glycosyltransferase UGT5-like n=1 Tax=Helicoverpa zea TaxID=7113 RepID=UPI001F593155|nr:UDP-glycosyltransferase UGT5-like [Helicoverpa zea]
MTDFSYFIVVHTLVLLLSQGEAAKILVYIPTPSISHQVVFRPLTQALAARGHEVTVVTTDPAFPKGGAPPNLKEIDVHDISYNIWRTEVMKASRGEEIDDILAPMSVMLYAVEKAFEAQLQHPEVQALIKGTKNKHFDLLIAEAHMAMLLAFAHIYKTPVIQASSLGAYFGNYETVGAPTHPFLYPHVMRRKLNNLSVWDKVTELYDQYRLEKLIADAQPGENALVEKYFGPGIPPVSELLKNVDMLFLNENPIFGDVRPVPPAVVFMGGLHQNPEKDLPEDLKTFLDSSKHGVIYISYGTNVDPTLLPPEKIQAMIEVLSQLPYDVLWKWSKDELPGRTPNIRISKWLPQSDLLKHPKVKLFITQGGLQSTDEAITAGVPLIGMPMIADQWYNVERYVAHKIGVRLDMETLTEENFKNAINKTIGDDSYRKNIVRLRNIIQDQPQKPLDRAVWWTEYVIRHGGAKHLLSPAAHITWTEFLELKLVFTLLAVFLTAVVAVLIALYLVFKFVRSFLKGSVKVKRS